MSKREEDFEKSAMDYCEDHSHCIYFVAGCEYGYQYAIDKACEWFETKTREEQIRSKAKELGQKYFPDEANVLWKRGNLEAQCVESACVEMAEWVDRHPQWIPVEDRLPAKRKDPLVISDKVFIHTNGGHYLSAVYDYQDKQWIDVYNIETLESNEVTHWMPLHQPPKKGGQE